MKSKLLLVLFLLTNTVFAQAPTNGLIAYYPLNGNANDASGNTNNGSIYGTINPVSDHNGNVNGAFQFTDGSKIRVINNASLYLTNGFSYSAWVRLRSFAGYDGNTGMWADYGTHAIFSKNCDQAMLSSTMSSLSSNTINYNTGTWNGAWQSDFFSYTLGNWINVAVSYDASTAVPVLVVFINGKIVAKSGGRIDFTSTNSVDLIIGGMDCWNYFFNGDMDELRFYNRGLTEQEIAATYEYEKAPVVSINNGNWEDTSVWSCNCVPTSTDVVQVKHAINVPAKTTAYAWNVQYSNNGQVTLSSEARLRLSK